MNAKAKSRLKYASKFFLALILISYAILGCTQSYSSAPAVTPTTFPTGAFISPYPSAENPMAMIEEFAKATAAALQNLNNPNLIIWAEIDKNLGQSMRSSLAYNSPDSMKLDESVKIELLINPALSLTEMQSQVTEPGTVVTSTIDITPFMKAELFSDDKDALAIQKIHDNPIQPIGSNTTTKWEWTVHAEKGGKQSLTLVVSRLVKAQGQDHWAMIQTYTSNINVEVDISKRVQQLDWKWIAGFMLALVSSVLGILSWLNNRKKKTEEENKSSSIRRIK